MFVCVCVSEGEGERDLFLISTNIFMVLLVLYVICTLMVINVFINLISSWQIGLDRIWGYHICITLEILYNAEIN